MNYLPKDHPNVLLAQYKNIVDSESDTLEDFLWFIENSDLIHDEVFETREDEDKFYVILNKLVDKYLMKDEESQTKLKRTEQQQLKDWISAVKGEKK